jgi:hypothetical protein
MRVIDAHAEGVDCCDHYTGSMLIVEVIQTSMLIWIRLTVTYFRHHTTKLQEPTDFRVVQMLLLLASRSISRFG